MGKPEDSARRLACTCRVAHVKVPAAWQAGKIVRSRGPAVVGRPDDLARLEWCEQEDAGILAVWCCSPADSRDGGEVPTPVDPEAKWRSEATSTARHGAANGNRPSTLHGGKAHRTSRRRFPTHPVARPSASTRLRAVLGQARLCTMLQLRSESFGARVARMRLHAVQVLSNSTKATLEATCAKAVDLQLCITIGIEPWLSALSGSVEHCRHCVGTVGRQLVARSPGRQCGHQVSPGRQVARSLGRQ
eukprot:7114858-Prymnesium_polylepis.1